MPATTLQTVSVIDSAVDCPDLPIVLGAGSAKAVVWPGTGAKYRTFQMIVLEPGSKTIVLKHPSESAFYVVSGGGDVVDAADGRATALVEGAMIHIGPGDAYRFVAGTTQGMTILGGPCPADADLYRHLTKD